MKTRVTQKAIKEDYRHIIKIGYCNLQSLLSYRNPEYYTIRSEGWGADIYRISPDTVIVTGYSPFGNIRPDYNVIRRYEAEAEKIKRDYSLIFEERKQKLDNLILAFIKEVLKC